MRLYYNILFHTIVLEEKRREEKGREGKGREEEYHQYLTYSRSSQCLPSNQLRWSKAIQEVTELTAGTQIHSREDQTSTQNT